MLTNESQTYWARIYMAGDISDARRVCREYAFNFGACVTVTPTEYVYSGGRESGFIVGFINYPRFPKEPQAIKIEAERLALLLADACCQKSWTVETPEVTCWFSRPMPFEKETA